MNTTTVLNGLYPDQNRRSVYTELGPNYLQCYQLTRKELGTKVIMNTQAAKYK